MLKKLLDEDNSDRFGVGVRRYLRLLKLIADGRWSGARTLVDRLLVTGGGISHFWELKSDVLAELGKQDASRDALERAIELEPLRMSLREKALSRAASRLTYAQYLEEFDSLLAEDPDDKRLLWGRAAALQDGPDGKAWQQAALDAIRWFPRNPSGYSGLMSWYGFQGRADLADALLAKARQMLPDVFGKEADSQGETTSPPDRAVESELPEDKDAILNLVWEPGDPRRAAALARAIELEQSGHLRWYEVARLLACRLLIPDNPAEEPADSETLLPAKPPGAAHWFAGVLCQVLTEYEPGLRTALAVNRWLDNVVTDVRSYPDLWFQRVLLLEHGMQMERALDELRQLLDRYPATSSALYRMGVVKYRQEDFPAARRCFEQALEVNPGLLGAMDMLRAVHEVRDNREDHFNCTMLLRRKMPYSIAYLRDEVLAVAERQSAEAAERVLTAAAGDFPERRVAVLRARLYMTAGRTQEAARLLSQINASPDDDEDLFEECLQAKLDIALENNNRADVLALCEEGLCRWPDSTRLKEIQAEQLAEHDPDRSRLLLRHVLCEGDPQPQTAWQYLSVAGQPADAAAREVILAAPEVRRQRLAVLFSEIMGRHDLLRWNAPYLEWALREFPESDALRWRLAIHYDVNEQVDKALKLAKELHRRNPDNPEAVRMLGRCLIDRDARQALSYLEKVCEQDRSADYLFDLARCHQIAGNSGKSKQLHWEILEQKNPYLSSSWTNLYVFGAPPERLWPYLPPMLERGRGVDDQYFLVAAVKIAIDRRQTLPAAWLPLALQRREILKTHPGFGDERSRLLSALLAWQWKRPAEISEQANLPPDFVQSLAARFWWPRCSWIPLA